MQALADVVSLMEVPTTAGVIPLLATATSRLFAVGGVRWWVEFQSRDSTLNLLDSSRRVVASVPALAGTRALSCHVNPVASAGHDCGLLLRVVLHSPSSVQFISIINGEFSASSPPLRLPSTVCSAFVSEDHVVTCTSSKYLLLRIAPDTSLHVCDSLTLPSKSHIILDLPAHVLIQDNHKSLLLTKNLANLFSRVEKELTWSANLITAVLSFPYIVALLPRGLEIRSLNNILVQKIPLRRPLDLFESVSSDMYIVCEREIWRLVQKSLEEQVAALLFTNSHELALNLLTSHQAHHASEKTPLEYRKLESHIHIHQALHCFHTHSFNLAFSHFLTLNINPLDVIRLFPIIANEGNDLLYSPADNSVFGTLSSLMSGLVELCEYLLKIRGQAIQKMHLFGELLESELHKLLQGVDTALLFSRIFLATHNYPGFSDRNICATVKGRNWVHVVDVESLLISRNLFDTLIALYASHSMHSNALSFLSSLMTSSDTEMTTSTSAHNLIQYLTTLPPTEIDLLFTYGSLLFEMSLPMAEKLKPFVSITPTTSICRRIVDFLDTFSDTASTTYLELIRKIFPNAWTPATSHDLVVRYIRNNDTENLTEALRLQEYDFKAVLKLLASSRHTINRAIVLGRLGRHKDALTLLVEVGSLVEAEAYCRLHYRHSAEVFLILLDELRQKYIQAHDGDNQALPDQIVGLLNRNAAFIQPCTVLERVASPSLPLSQLVAYICSHYISLTATLHSALPIRNIALGEKTLLRVLKTELQQKMLNVLESRVCQRCFGKLVSGVVVYIPCEGVVHLMCLNKQ